LLPPLIANPAVVRVPEIDKEFDTSIALDWVIVPVMVRE